MKKIVCIVLLLGMLLTLCSCTKTDEEEELKYVEVLLYIDSKTRINWREAYNQVSLEHNIEYVAVGYSPHASVCGEDHDYEPYNHRYFYFYEMPNGCYYYVDPVCEHLRERWSLESAPSSYYLEDKVLYHNVSGISVYDTITIGMANKAHVVRFYYK